MSKLDKILIGIALALTACGIYYILHTPARAITITPELPKPEAVLCCCPVPGGGMECEYKMTCRCK